MDPISLAVLAALAGGAGGEIGRQAWAGLSGVVRRKRHTDGETPQGEDETAPAQRSETALAALEEEPADLGRAGDLERALREQREADEEFARAVRVWEASFQATLAADPEAAADLQAAVRALTPDDDEAGARSAHNDFRHGKFDGPVQGSGTQHITYNK